MPRRSASHQLTYFHNPQNYILGTSLYTTAVVSCLIFNKCLLWYLEIRSRHWQVCFSAIAQKRQGKGNQTLLLLSFPNNVGFLWPLLYVQYAYIYFLNFMTSEGYKLFVTERSERTQASS